MSDRCPGFTPISTTEIFSLFSLYANLFFKPLFKNFAPQKTSLGAAQWTSPGHLTSLFWAIQGEWWAIVISYRVEKGTLSSAELHGWCQRRKMDLYGWAVMSAVGEVWLTRNVDARMHTRGEGGSQRAEKNFYIDIFPVLP